MTIKMVSTQHSDQKIEGVTVNEAQAKKITITTTIDGTVYTSDDAGKG